MSVREKRAAGIYLPDSAWKRMSDRERASHVRRAIGQIQQHGRAAPFMMPVKKASPSKAQGLKRVGTATMRSGKQTAVYLRPAPRKLGKFKKTGVKGKNLSETHYKNMLRSGARGRPASRRFGSAGGTTMVGHDFAGTLVVLETASEADVVMSISVNPVDLGFPALTIESQLHQQYEFQDFAVHFVRSGTAFLTGDMLGWYDRDPDEILPQGIEGIQVGYYKNGTTAAFKDGHVFHMPRFPDLPLLFTRDISSDERLVNQCVFNLQVVTPPSVFNGGEAEQVELPVEFWVSYRCRFSVKDITFNPRDNFPNNHVWNNAQSGAVTLDGNVTGGVFCMANSSTGVINDNVNWFPNLNDYGPLACVGLPGMFWGYKNTFGSGVIGMLAGYGFNKARRFDILWSSLKTSKLTALGVDPGFPALYINCTIDSSYGRVAPYTASADAGTYNTQQTHLWHVVVNNPGQIQTPDWSSNDRIWFIDHDGTVALLPYDATREQLWEASFIFNGTGTATVAVTAETQYLDVSLVEYEGFGLISPAITPGPATLEGIVKDKFQKMDNKERCEYKGEWQRYLSHVRELRKPKPKPLPDYLQTVRGMGLESEIKETKEQLAMALPDARARPTAPSPVESKVDSRGRQVPAPNGTVVDIEDLQPGAAVAVPADKVDGKWVAVKTPKKASNKSTS